MRLRRQKKNGGFTEAGYADPCQHGRTYGFKYPKGTRIEVVVDGTRYQLVDKLPLFGGDGMLTDDELLALTIDADGWPRVLVDVLLPSGKVVSVPYDPNTARTGDGRKGLDDALAHVRATYGAGSAEEVELLELTLTQMPPKPLGESASWGRQIAAQYIEAKKVRGEVLEIADRRYLEAHPALMFNGGRELAETFCRTPGSPEELRLLQRELAQWAPGRPMPVDPHDLVLGRVPPGDETRPVPAPVTSALFVEECAQAMARAGSAEVYKADARPGSSDRAARQIIDWETLRGIHVSALQTGLARSGLSGIEERLVDAGFRGDQATIELLGGKDSQVLAGLRRALPLLEEVGRDRRIPSPEAAGLCVQYIQKGLSGEEAARAAVLATLDLDAPDTGLVALSVLQRSTPAQISAAARYNEAVGMSRVWEYVGAVNDAAETFRDNPKVAPYLGEYGDEYGTETWYYAVDTAALALLQDDYYTPGMGLLLAAPLPVNVVTCEKTKYGDDLTFVELPGGPIVEFDRTRTRTEVHRNHRLADLTAPPPPPPPPVALIPEGTPVR